MKAPLNFQRRFAFHEGSSLPRTSPEVIEQGSWRIHKPETDVTTIGRVGPGGDTARGKQCSIAIDLHRSIRTGTRSKLIPVGEGDREAAAMLDPSLGRVIRPDLHGLSGSIVPDCDQSGRHVLAALRFQDQAVFIARTRIDLCQRDIGFLVGAKGGGVPLNKCIRAGGDHIQLVGRDTECGGISRPTASNDTIGTIEIVAHNRDWETIRGGGCSRR
jgi:hypothetical protein